MEIGLVLMGFWAAGFLRAKERGLAKKAANILLEKQLSSAGAVRDSSCF